MPVTISTHNGSTLSREHNIRNERITSKQGHINPAGIHEVWADEKLALAFDRLFREHVEDYNLKQPPYRRINNYLGHIRKSAQAKPCYEMIIGVYKGCPADIGKQIMRNYVETWQQRNPNLIMIGAYYHADEEGEPHVHIDYVPYGTGYKKGMAARCSLTKALENMGFKTQGKNTAQMQWIAAENQTLENICNLYGLEVEHPQKDKESIKHKHTAIYKLDKDIHEKAAELEIASNSLENEKSKVNALENQKNALMGQIRALESKIERLASEGAAADERLALAKEELQELQGKVLTSKQVEKTYTKPMPFSQNKLQIERQLFNNLYSTAVEVDAVKHNAEQELKDAKKERARAAEMMNNAKVKLNEAKRIYAKAEAMEQYNKQIAAELKEPHAAFELARAEAKDEAYEKAKRECSEMLDYAEKKSQDIIQSAYSRASNIIADAGTAQMFSKLNDAERQLAEYADFLNWLNDNYNIPALSDMLQPERHHGRSL